MEFTQKHNLHHDPGVYALDLMSELGEVAKEILLATEYGQKAPNFTNDFAGELGDMLYSLCLLASSTGVDLEAAFSATLEKYERRWQRKGHMGSSEAA